MGREVAFSRDRCPSREGRVGRDGVEVGVGADGERVPGLSGITDRRGIGLREVVGLVGAGDVASGHDQEPRRFAVRWRD
ncbi:hypothetical protein BH23ACT6_BH23ACT6_08600 [soil metagenome]